MTAPRETRPERDVEALLAALPYSGLHLSGAPLVQRARAFVLALVWAEEALYEGFWNCGFEEDCLWAEPLGAVQGALDELDARTPPTTERFVLMSARELGMDGSRSFVVESSDPTPLGVKFSHPSRAKAEQWCSDANAHDREQRAARLAEEAEDDA